MKVKILLALLGLNCVAFGASEQSDLVRSKLGNISKSTGYYALCMKAKEITVEPKEFYNERLNYVFNDIFQEIPVSAKFLAETKDLFEDGVLLFAYNFATSYFGGLLTHREYESLISTAKGYEDFWGKIYKNYDAYLRSKTRFRDAVK